MVKLGESEKGGGAIGRYRKMEEESGLDGEIVKRMENGRVERELRGEEEG